MALGRTPRQTGLLRSTVDYCDGRVAPDSIYGILHRECFALFSDGMFADLFTDIGRRSVPPMIVAVVMVLQRIEGLSDREAVDRFAFDARWKYAAGGLDFDYPGFVHTVLVDMRARLARSDRPDRIFQVVLDVAHQAGLVGRRRVLDSTPIYDAVATMDTMTLIRSAIRGLLAATDTGLTGELRAAITSGDDYSSTAKPQIDWDDAAAREALIDSRARDGFAILALVEGRRLDAGVDQAARLLATVLGQDLIDDNGVFRIARKVAVDRVISTVDTQTRHGHKTNARSFDGYKGHLAADPDSEIITATTVTPGNTGDAEVAERLLADVLPPEPEPEPEDRPAVYGDAAYGAGDLLARLDNASVYNGLKVQPPARVKGHYGKDSFTIDLDAQTVTCPAGITTGIRAHGGRHAGTAEFGAACADCRLRGECTTAAAGRTISISPHEVHLAAGRARQADPVWKADYRATRPKVERKIGHLMRQRHGGRRARVRGLVNVAADFSLLAAAVNLARMGRLGITSAGSGWVTAA
ncbi:IS1182 family transposase [Amycolatopsis acididurans]|uniref:IS1182 family transposase n=1 Tax=Amycolatopsis acididurans TaxID=2724524 RepID=UPI00406BBB58